MWAPFLKALGMKVRRTIARNSMVQTGCIVAGEVSDSTLLRGARIESGADV